MFIYNMLCYVRVFTKLQNNQHKFGETAFKK